MASRDLKALVDGGLLTAAGETRGRAYAAAPILMNIRLRNRQPRVTEDPFDQHPDQSVLLDCLSDARIWLSEMPIFVGVPAFGLCNSCRRSHAATCFDENRHSFPGSGHPALSPPAWRAGRRAFRQRQRPRPPRRQTLRHRGQRTTRARCPSPSRSRVRANPLFRPHARHSGHCHLRRPLSRTERCHSRGSCWALPTLPRHEDLRLPLRLRRVDSPLRTHAGRLAPGIPGPCACLRRVHPGNVARTAKPVRNGRSAGGNERRHALCRRRGRHVARRG